jgi:hypothetical protein
MKSLKPRTVIMLVITAMMLQACYCLGSAIPWVVCMREDGSTYTYGQDDLWGRDECGENGDTHAGLSYTIPTDTPPLAEPTTVPPVLPNPGQNNIVAPTGLNCNSLQLTSPLSGLPNGAVTFYWNALPGAVSYRINLYDNSGNFLASFDSQPGATSLSADVSWGAIGGQYDIQVELVAFGGGTSCRKTITIPREAPAGGVPNNGGGGNGGGNTGGAPAATATPTCQQDPAQNWCIR